MCASRRVSSERAKREVANGSAPATKSEMTICAAVFCELIITFAACGGEGTGALGCRYSTFKTGRSTHNTVFLFLSKRAAFVKTLLRAADMSSDFFLSLMSVIEHRRYSSSARPMPVGAR